VAGDSAKRVYARLGQWLLRREKQPVVQHKNITQGKDGLGVIFPYECSGDLLGAQSHNRQG
jgi:hypothetical protein